MLMLILGSGLIIWLQTLVVGQSILLLRVLHVALGIGLVPFVVMPFFMQHRCLLLGSKRSLSKWSGLALEFVFYAQVVIGSYLLLFANYDGLQDSAQWLHLRISLVLVTFVILHFILVKIIRK